MHGGMSRETSSKNAIQEEKESCSLQDFQKIQVVFFLQSFGILKIKTLWDFCGRFEENPLGDIDLIHSTVDRTF